jgi:hypothetical protein
MPHAQRAPVRLGAVAAGNTQASRLQLKIEEVPQSASSMSGSTSKNASASARRSYRHPPNVFPVHILCAVRLVLPGTMIKAG